MRPRNAGIPAGHRPYRPPAGTPVQLPEAFGRRFAVFVDVEEEFDWRAPLDPANRATTAIRALGPAHQRFAASGVGLTCMVDHPVATDPRAVETLRRIAADGRSAIGAQLHAWVTPPLQEQATPFTSYAGNLPRGQERAKLATLTDALATAFGERPLAFRAGRYGLGPNSFALLAEAGYRLDSSVRPGFDYRDEGGPDFTGQASRPARHGAILEVPLTTVFTGAAGVSGSRWYRQLGRFPHARGIAARLGLVSRVSLTPEGMPLRDVLPALDVARAERMLVFSFHSPSLVPGHTPYVRDAADLDAFWRWWDGVLGRLDELGFQHASLAEILAATA